MPLPLAHGLIGASVVAVARSDLTLRRVWPQMLLGASLAIIPDFDLFLAWGLNYSLRVHGGFTHSVVFACAAGPLVALLAREYSSRGVLTYTAATLSHALLDFLTKKDFGGAQLLWPFSAHKFRLGLFSYYEFYPDPGSQALGQIVEEALKISCYEALTFIPVFAVVVGWKQWQCWCARR